MAPPPGVQFAILLVAIVADPCVVRAEAWRSGLSIGVAETVEAHASQSLGASTQSRAEIRYIVTTASAPQGLRIAVSKVEVLSNVGDPDLRGNVDREVAFLRSAPPFVVSRDGELLQTDVTDGATRDQLRQRWDSWSAVSRWIGGFGARTVSLKVPRPGYQSMTYVAHRTFEPTPCPDGRRVCVRLRERTVLDEAGKKAARAAMEAAVRRASPDLRVVTYDETSEGSWDARGDRLPIRSRAVRRRDTVLAAGEQTQQITQTEEVRVEFSFGAH